MNLLGQYDPRVDMNDTALDLYLSKSIGNWVQLVYQRTQGKRNSYTSGKRNDVSQHRGSINSASSLLIAKSFQNWRILYHNMSQHVTHVTKHWLYLLIFPQAHGHQKRKRKRSHYFNTTSWKEFWAESIDERYHTKRPDWQYYRKRGKSRRNYYTTLPYRTVFCLSFTDRIFSWYAF